MDAVRAVERITGTFLLPGVLLVVGTATYTTLNLAGTHTIYQLFGTEDALQILRPLYDPPDARFTSPLGRILAHLSQHWRLDVGLPLIPTVLIASRTTFADSFLPFLPLIFFVSSGQPGDEMLQLQWPPSAAFSFAALPYLRGFYNAFYDRVCLPAEKRWLKEIQPRADTEEDGDAEILIQEVNDGAHDHNHGADDEFVDDIQIELDLDIFGGWNGGNEADHNDAQDDGPGLAPPLNAPPMADNVPPLGAAQAGAAAPAPNVPAARPQPRVRERGINFTTSNLADTILGALVFPSIAAAMGELLNFALPRSWVTPPSGSIATSWLGGWITTGGRLGGGSRPTGFLQTRWGRSLVGGCMFVGLKDMVLLYVRWKMAQSHRKRRILDSPDRKKGRK